MRRAYIGLITFTVAAGLPAGLESCGGDDTSTVPPYDGGGDASFDAPRADSQPPKDGNASDTQTSDVADSGTEAGSSPVFLAHFDQTMGQNPEGLWELSVDAGSGTPIVGFAPLAQLVTVGPDGGVTAFGNMGAASHTFTLGIVTDSSGNVYVGVGASGAAPNTPPPGVYKFGPTGGTGVVFSLGSAVTPPMNFANGLDFITGNMFVADSGGTIYKVDNTGLASVWSADPLLAPNMTACGGVVPLPVGANGIAHDANNVYVTNTNFGRLIQIPITTGGGAGTATVIKEDCATLAGADGLLIDSKDNSFIVAVNVQNKLVRVAPGGATTTTIVSGSPLDFPASVYIDTVASQRRLLWTNAAFFSGDAGKPGLLWYPIP